MRELDIKLMLPLQKRHWIFFFLSMLLIALLLWMMGWGITHDPSFGSFQLLFFTFLMLQSAYRLRYLKSLYLRIGEAGLSWRLIDGVEYFQQWRPPISEHALRWERLRGVRHEASGMRCLLDDDATVFLPLSNLSYAQRQEVKRVTELHLAERNIELIPFVPAGWHETGNPEQFGTPGITDTKG
ncbi:MAG: hypothetical protein KFF77_00035 [Bacteroidetes bacterium]|nr:hypothetical protein [Bacteroidota bacterium]